MANSLTFYADAGLTEPFVAALSTQHNADGSSDPVDSLVYLGSTVASKKFQATSNPGVDQIAVSVVDADPGTGQPATAVKLASTLLGLDSAVAGAALNLGTQILSGVANAKPVFIRIDPTTSGDAETHTDLSLATNGTTESAV